MASMASNCHQLTPRRTTRESGARISSGTVESEVTIEAISYHGGHARLSQLVEVGDELAAEVRGEAGDEERLAVGGDLHVAVAVGDLVVLAGVHPDPVDPSGAEVEPGLAVGEPGAAVA